MTRLVPRNRRWALHCGALVIALGLGLIGRSLAWEAFGPPAPPRLGIRPSGGALLICGGGTMPEEVKGRFFDLAGGPDARIVVIPTAHAAADSPQADSIYLEPWRQRGPASVTMLHTRSRADSDNPAFLKPLLDATGVWIGGGSQLLLAQTYGGTAVERQLKAIIARGGVVGGSSAGAAIMTRVMIQGGRAEAKEGVGFDLLSDAIVDQHFLKRRRLNRLLGLLTKHPTLLGFGIDEGTALLVRGNHLAVLGESYVVACLPPPEGKAMPRVEFLRRGDEADLASLRTPAPRIVASILEDEDQVAEVR